MIKQLENLFLSRAPMFDSQNPHIDSVPSVTPVPRDSMTSSNLHGQVHTFSQNAHIYEINKSKEN